MILDSLVDRLLPLERSCLFKRYSGLMLHRHSDRATHLRNPG